MFSCLEASRALGVSCELENPAIHIQGASIDTRTLEPGNLFVALEGRQTDGHQFISDAFLRGAAAAILHRDYFQSHRDEWVNHHSLYQNLFPVMNPQKAFFDLAYWYRSTKTLKAIGITGSIGKTSTKEFLSYLLKCSHPILSSQGNFNNQLGLPLTLFRLQASHHYLIAELGASQKGDILELSSLLKPDAAILTQISPAHLKSFGTIKDIYDTKTEIYKLLPRKAPLVLPDYDELLIAKAEKYDLKVITVGYGNDADYCISHSSCENSKVTFILNGRWTFQFPGLATFLAFNAAMAVAMAEALGMSIEAMPRDWKIELPKGRFQERLYANGIQVIDDSYNANPSSLKKALETFSSLKGKGKKFVVLSDMLELGEEEERFHQALGKDLSRYHFDYVLAFGPLSKFSIDALKENHHDGEAIYFNHFEELADFLNTRARGGDQILFKASRGMKMENILGRFEQQFGPPLEIR